MGVLEIKDTLLAMCGHAAEYADNTGDFGMFEAEEEQWFKERFAELLEQLDA